MAAPVIDVASGENNIVLQFTLTDKDGNAIDVSTGYTFKVKVRRASTNANTNDSSNTCSINDGVNGKFYYQITATDFPADGTYYGQLWITFPDTTVHKVPHSLIFQAFPGF
jgi:hypothetical protein